MGVPQCVSVSSDGCSAPRRLLRKAAGMEQGVVDLILRKSNSFRRVNSRISATGLSALDADLKCHILYHCDFEHKVMLLETSKDMNEVGKGDFEWERKYLETKERFQQARSKLDNE